MCPAQTWLSSQDSSHQSVSFQESAENRSRLNYKPGTDRHRLHRCFHHTANTDGTIELFADINSKLGILQQFCFWIFAAERFLYKLKHLAQIFHHILAAIQLIQIALYRVLNTDEDAGQKFLLATVSPFK